VKRYAILVAGGKGNRMKTDIPKQFLMLCGKPVLMHTIERFAAFDNAIKIILVLPSSQIDYWKELCKEFQLKIPVEIASGGTTRFESVRNGLVKISDNKSIVGIHDGVRPLVSQETLTRCYTHAEKCGTAIPVVEMIDSVRQTITDGSIPVDRTKLFLVQTPQVFHYTLLHNAYEQPYKEIFTDDASVLESINVKIDMVEGNRENIKITTPTDIVLAEALLQNGC
jgi:2-C-methyl-D-erythritol 4-phosphate cytidylyltransferase